MTFDNVKTGDSVMYYLPTNTRNPGEGRPARVVKVWSAATGLVNLVVDVDSSNDGYAGPTAWATSVLPSAQRSAGSWCWPEAV